MNVKKMPQRELNHRLRKNTRNKLIVNKSSYDDPIDLSNENGSMLKGIAPLT